MFPQGHQHQLFWTVVLFVCVPFILICYIMSIIKTIRDRRLILKLQEQKKIRNLKPKRRVTYMDSDCSGSKSKLRKAVKKDSLTLHMIQTKTPPPGYKEMVSEKLKEFKLNAEVEDKPKIELRQSANLGNDSSNNALIPSFLGNDIVHSDCAQKCVCVSGAVFGKCKVKES